jgi:hypothetical protein
MIKIETTILLSEAVVQALEAQVSGEQERAAFVEEALWAFLRQAQVQGQAQHDLEILNWQADALNEEAVDVLEYQESW